MVKWLMCIFKQGEMALRLSGFSVVYSGLMAASQEKS
jgi:hypothetical protein